MFSVTVGCYDEEFAILLGSIAQFGEGDALVAVDVGHAFRADVVYIYNVLGDDIVGILCEVLRAVAGDYLAASVVDDDGEAPHTDERLAESASTGEEKSLAVVVGEPFDYRAVVAFVPHSLGCGEVVEASAEIGFGIGHLDIDLVGRCRVASVAETVDDLLDVDVHGYHPPDVTSI